MNHISNLERIKLVFDALGPLQNQVVFVGGATVGFYVDRMAEEVRPTIDVDVVVEILTYGEYANLEEKLRKLGFANDQDSRIICRYKIQGTVVDIMPTGEEVFGFRNKWYAEGCRNSISVQISNDTTIRIFSLPFFIASKIDAFLDRGKNDGRTSTDFEDIVYVMEYCGTIWEQLENAPSKVKEFLRHEFSLLMADPYFFDWIDAHTSYGAPPATYDIIKELRSFVER